MLKKKYIKLKPKRRQNSLNQELNCIKRNNSNDNNRIGFFKLIDLQRKGNIKAKENFNLHAFTIQGKGTLDSESKIKSFTDNKGIKGNSNSKQPSRRNSIFKGVESTEGSSLKMK